MATETVDDIPYVPVAVPSVVAAPSVVKEPASVAIPVNHAERPEKFNGQNFKRWQQKMFFYLTTLNLARFLTKDAPKPKEGETDIQVASAIDAWHHSDFLCKNYVMNGLSDSLYNVYIGKKTAKELWESLDRKYKTEDAGTKKFVVGRFLDFKMVDSKTVISQVQELQIILSEILAEGMHLSETFQVAAIIEKLPPAWKDFKSYLKHKQKEMNIEGLVVKLRIEEDNRNAERIGAISMAKANFVEHGPKKKKKKLGPKGGISKKQTKFQGKCYNCDKMGHKASDCRLPKKKREANVVENITQHVSDINLSAVVLEVNMVGSNPREWWIDTGATRHVCSDKGLFTSFEAASNREKLFMGNSATSEIEGQGKVALKMTSGKELTLNNVLYVPEIRKNLVSGSLLNKHGFRMVFESDMVVLSKNGMYVGKGYVNDGLFKLNVMTLKPTINNKATSSAYLLESSNIWHGRLGHVNFNSLRKLINMKHIPNFQIDLKHKCKTCVEAKLTRSSFQIIQRNSEPLDLIHSDICDFKSIQTRGGNKYFITFIDDCTKYCYVYLLKSKDEALDKFILYKNEVENQLNRKIKELRSDRGGEYVVPFMSLCEQSGIIHQVTAPYSPQSNGIAERKNRTLKEMMNAMLISSGLPQNMWGEAVLSANYLLNKIPRKQENTTPYELWKGRSPSYKFLRVWGCLAKVVVPLNKKVKI
uniref:Pol polyprotein n=1 Tax=Citrus paradisi TaxID=37656 RepID=Q94FM0_CITPA|nr:pol polyprotein [Citrus x paradisi]